MGLGPTLRGSLIRFPCVADPRFDARFQLGYEMGPEHQPWWVDGGRAAEQRRQLELARKEAEELRAGSSAGMLQRGAATKEDLQRERVLREQAERTRVR